MDGSKLVREEMLNTLIKTVKNNAMLNLNNDLDQVIDDDGVPSTIEGRLRYVQSMPDLLHPTDVDEERELQTEPNKNKKLEEQKKQKVKEDKQESERGK